MKDVLGLVRKFGWLPASQAVVFLISTLGFAILAHVLGPTQFARFAGIILIFSIVSLLTDLSPQNYALVNGTSAGVLRTATRLAVISGCLGITLVVLAGLASSNIISGGPLSTLEFVLLALAMIGQLGMQVQRAELVSTGRYRSIAICDIGSTFFGVLLALFLALGPHSGLALVAQLASTAVAKGLCVRLAAHGLHREVSTGMPHDLAAALKYGLSVIPLNVASYLGRALDSGILPSLVPAAAAAGYARSYQVIVVPVTQLQLALGPAILERLSREKRTNGGKQGSSGKVLWTWMSRFIFVAAVLICALAVPIEQILFGPKWPMVHVTIVAMAACLPGIGLTTYGSWALQIDGGGRRTCAHFCAAVITPLAVVLAASIGSFPAAVGTLVIVGGLIQPVLLSFIHISALPGGLPKAVLTAISQWLVLASVFIFTADSSAFWTTSF